MLMRQIMHYDVEFRREEALCSQLSREALTAFQSRLEHGGQFDPTPMLDRPGGHWARKRSFPVLRALRFSKVLRISFDWTASPFGTISSWVRALMANRRPPRRGASPDGRRRAKPSRRNAKRPDGETIARA